MRDGVRSIDAVATLKLMWKGFTYVLALMGSAFGGFPPPRIYTPEREPDEVMERVVDHDELEEGEHSELELVVTRRAPVPRLRTPETR